jgi:hypothetical protein
MEQEAEAKVFLLWRVRDHASGLRGSHYPRACAFVELAA